MGISYAGRTVLEVLKVLKVLKGSEVQVLRF